MAELGILDVISRKVMTGVMRGCKLTTVWIYSVILLYLIPRPDGNVCKSCLI